MDKLSFALILSVLAIALNRYLMRYHYGERHHFDTRETAYYTKYGQEKVIVYRYPTLRKA